MTGNAKSRWASALAVAALLAAVACLLVFKLTPPPGVDALPSFDTYSYAYPVMLTAADAVRHAGQGLFWSPMQDCGQPFLGSGTTGTLYPPFLFALLWNGDSALYALLFFNAAVGALGAFLLCRELGTGVVAALCAGLTFGCSNAICDVLTSTPLVSGPYAWMPVALWCFERLLRMPSLKTGVQLGVVLTIALLPGHPQILLYIYQILALRTLFEMVTRRSWLGFGVLGPLLLGLVIPPFLGAVHLVPALEVMHASIRGSELSTGEIETPGGIVDWASMHAQFARRGELFDPFLIVPVMLASAALVTRRFGRQAVFYGVLALVSIDMSLGSNGYLFGLYAQLPLVRLFRWPFRYLWILAFCMSVLVGIGVDTIVTAGTRSGPWPRRLGVVLLPAIALGVLHWWTPNVGALPWEALYLSAALAACALAAFVPRLRYVAAAVITASLLVNVLVLRPTPFMTLMWNGDAVLHAKAPVFELLRTRFTAQDRIHIVGKHGDETLQQKTGSLFGIPALTDYASLPTYRFANFFTMLRDGAPMMNLNSYYYPLGGMMPQSLRRRLLDLAAIRYLVVDSDEDKSAAVFRNPPLQLLFDMPSPQGPQASVRLLGMPAPDPAARSSVRVYENPTAMPRARWVPRVDVVADPPALLQRLSTGKDDLTKVALLEAPPSSGFLGEKGESGPGAVAFLRNDPEDLVLQVDAPSRGFVVVADQWFAGWHATANGEPTDILRANYVFRLVEVPAGHSVVEFHYVSDSLREGMLITTITAAALAVALYFSRRKTA